MQYLIETKDLTKHYGLSTVVKSINLRVPKGKIYGLLGRNGAGKTTAMKMMLHLVNPSSGTIQLFGEDYKENKNKLYSKIGSIIETPGFYHNLNAYENLHIISRLHDCLDTKSIYESLEIVGLQKELDKPFASYSLGMKQRLGIAAAIMHRPELLILDEPTNGLDPIGISEVRSLLSKLSETYGRTVFISSHVLGEIEQIADNIGVMHDGRLIEEVNIAELHKRNRRHIEFDVSDTTVAARLLERKFKITDYTNHKNTIKIYDCAVDQGEVNKVFVANNLLVTRISIYEDSLESYFSGLIGGSGIA